MQGGRSADDIVEFMIKKSGPPATTLKSKDDAKAFLEKHAAGVRFTSPFSFSSCYLNLGWMRSVGERGLR
jgi:hypothetical protein